MSKKIGIIIAVISAAAFLALIGVLASGLSGNKQPTPEPTEVPFVPEEEEVVVENGSVLSLTNGLQLKYIARVSGLFFEDGSNDMVSNFLSATFVNNSEQYIQYAKVSLYCDGVQYCFELSTVPPHSIIRAFDINRKTAPVRAMKISGVVEQYVAFDKAPSRHEDMLEITASDNIIYVKNITDERIDGSFYVYYKNYDSGILVGGITYRVRVEGGIDAGATYTGYAPHFSDRYSQVMFVVYDAE